MPNTRSPRKGSMQYWPRKRAKRQYPRLRSNKIKVKDAKLLGFAGYKVGMTHMIVTKKLTTGKIKIMDVFLPATIIECPSLKIYSLRFYKNNVSGSVVVDDVLSENLDKELKRKTTLAKKKKKLEDVKKDYDEIRLVVYTQPKLTSIGKKKPEIFELKIGGKKEEQLEYAKSVFGKEINLGDVFGEGQYVDIHGITKGKGTQGPVKRFGISLKAKKSEKGQRRPGNLGAWTGGKQWRVAQAGKTGHYQRTEYSKKLLKMGKEENINPKGGFKHYGIVKNDYVLIKGSVPGPAKRLIVMSSPNRKNKQEEPLNIKYIKGMEE